MTKPAEPRGMLSSRAIDLAPSIIREMSGRRRANSIDLSLGEPRVPPEREVVERAFALLVAGPHGYTENAGMMELREAIARHHALPGRERGENVIVTVGSEEAVFLSMMATLDPGDEVLVPEPGYPAYRGIAGLIGATPVPYPIERSSGLVARSDALAGRLTPRTRVLVLNGPSNPFGSVDGAGELERIARLVETHGIVAISDEIYRDLTYGAHPPASIAAISGRSSILISGLSKSCSMTGFRLGYLIADAAFVKQATLAHQLVVTCASRMAQLAALQIFREPDRLRAHLPYYESARFAVREASRDLPEDAPMLLGDGAFYAVLDVSAYARSDPMALALRLLDEEDVVVVPGTAFGPGGDWFWRISYAAGPDASREGIRRIARFLASLRRRP